MRARRWLFAIWICFLIRAAFYCAAVPLWDGFDEWSHFGVVQRMAFRGEALVSRDAPLPRDVAATFDLVPLPWELRNYALPATAHDGFWRLPAEERARRQAQFRAIPPEWADQDSAGFKTYEGLQGPLYGWLMAPLLLLAGHAHLATQVLLLRLAGVCIASIAVPLTYFTCRRVVDDAPFALGCAAVTAAMPGLLVDVAHVSNEPLAVALFSLAIWLTVEIAVTGLTTRRAVLLGLTLGAGLITKAYFLVALPAVAFVLIWKRRERRAVFVPAVAGAVSAWWYIRNALTTGSATGMWETALLPHATLADQLRQAASIHWGVVVDSILFSHLWLGFWSTLTARSWTYHLLYLVIALAAAGLVRMALRGRKVAGDFDAPALLTLFLFFSLFWLGQLYHAITLYMVWGIATTLGGYLCAITIAEVALCAAGLRGLLPGLARRWAAPAGACLFAVFDLYVMNMVALPYFAGFTAHRPNGPLANFHPAAAPLGEAFTRLAAFKAPFLGEGSLAALWALYVAATVALAALAFRAAAFRKAS